MTDDPRTTDRADEVEHELGSGALCLDFCNTLGDRPRSENERLSSFADLLAFARQAESLEPAHARELGRLAVDDRAGAELALERGIALRESLFRLFAAIAAGRDAPPGDLAVLNDRLATALPHLRLASRGDGFGWRWELAADDPEAVLWPVARSAAELLVSADLARVHQCDSPTCSWLFVDRSPGRRRRWCDMKTCGNRAKARRFYRRHKASAG